MSDSPRIAPILADAVYPLDVFKSQTGFGDWALRKMKKKGLPIRRVSGRAFVIGSDWIEFLQREDAQKREATDRR